MNQSIRFSGLSLAKDEQAAANGELALCANVELHDGALRPSVLTGTSLANKLSVTYNDSSGTTHTVVPRLIYVHVTPVYTHYIAYVDDTQSLAWFNKDGSYGGLISHSWDSLSAINSVGNTLVCIDADGIHYSLWKNNDSGYKYLGRKPPFVDIQFGLSENLPADYDIGGIDAEGSSAGFNSAFQASSLSCGDAFDKPVKKNTEFTPGETMVTVKSKQRSTVTENVWALINRTNNLIAKQGHFYANFFVRYCYRLYDGSMVMHSSPVFMPVLVPDNYLVYVANASTDKVQEGIDPTADSPWSYTTSLHDSLTLERHDANGKECYFKVGKLTFMYVPRNVALGYFWASDRQTIENLKEWGDIVKSIDVFITPPVTRTDDAQMISNCVYQPDEYALNVQWKQVWKLNNDDNHKGLTTVQIPGISDQAYADKIAAQSAFFRVCSFKLDDMKIVYGFKEVPIDKVSLVNVTTHEQMKDDYKTHNYIYPSGMYVYNHRVNAYGLYERLFPGFRPTLLFGDNKYIVPSSTAIVVKKISVRLNTDDGYKFVSVSEQVNMDIYALYNLPKFYPDARADHMYVLYAVKDSGTDTWADFALKQCAELNGAMHVGVFSTDYPTVSAPVISENADTVQMPNRIYTSEQNNPYYFPLEGINSVGTGQIIGLASTTRALSQGQFGQFPLMAFASDGIWALNVSSTGTYSTIHPISREVCKNANSICQLDQSVVFATDRALNKVVESSVASFSDILDGPYFDIANALRRLADYFADDAEITMLISFDTPPIEYFKQGVIINDFTNNRLIIFPKRLQPGSDAKIVTLVYSIRDGAWSTMLCNRPLAVINSYPYPYVESADGSVIILDKKYNYTDHTPHGGLIVTRTLSFEGVMQCVSAFDQQTDAASPQLVFFFGSNDNRTWRYIGMSNRPHCSYLPGHSFRFFRLAVYTKMSCAEKYYQINLQITQKYQKL